MRWSKERTSNIEIFCCNITLHHTPHSHSSVTIVFYLYIPKYRSCFPQVTSSLVYIQWIRVRSSECKSRETGSLTLIRFLAMRRYGFYLFHCHNWNLTYFPPPNMCFICWSLTWRMVHGLYWNWLDSLYFVCISSYLHSSL